MKALVVGLGSMGKRRIRCLQALNITDIHGFGPRVDRCQEAVEKYGIKIVDQVSDSAILSRDVVILSVPPDKHHSYMEQCTRLCRHYFVEASVVDEGLMDLFNGAARAGIVAAPSATLLFHPGIQKITEMVSSGRLGKISNLLYHSGQYLPDWHVYEHVSEYYVSNPLTGGAREIVPFELSWLVKCFGWPKSLVANVRKTIDIPGAELIDDTYNILLDFGAHSGVVTVDVVSRVATRKLTIVGEAAQLVWDWDIPEIRVFDGTPAQWETVGYSVGKAAAGYNANIGEKMYIDEVDEFLGACQGQGKFRNNLAEDSRLLGILNAAEVASKQKKELLL